MLSNMGACLYLDAAGSGVAGIAVAAGAEVVGAAVGVPQDVTNNVATINTLNSRNSRFFI